MSIAKNYLLNLSYQILVVILPLITSPYIARNLGSEVIGIYTYTNSIAVYFSLMAALGIGTYASRQIAYDKNKGINSVSKTFWSIFYLKLIISSGVIVAYFLLVIFGIREYTDIYIAQSLVIFATLFDISWLFIGHEDFKKLVIRNFVVRIVSLIGLFTLVKSPSDLLTYTIIINVPNLIANLALWAKAKEYIKYIKVDKKDVKSHFKPSLRLFIPQLASQVYLLLDRVMLGSMSNYDQVGFYEMAQRIAKIGMVTLTSLSEVIMPRIASEFSQGNTDNILKYIKKTISYNLFLALPMTLGLITIADTFIPWFLGDEFIQVANILKITAFLILILSVAYVFVHQYLIPSGNENKFTISVLVGMVINIILNVILIKRMGAMGAATASVMAELGVTITQYFIVRKYINLKGCFAESYKYLVSALIMSGVVSLIGINKAPSLLNLIMQIGAGVIVYLVLNILFKSEAIMTIIGKCNERLPLKKFKLGSFIKK